MKASATILHLALAWLMLNAAAWGQGLPTASPEQVGLSSQRLGRITEVFKADVGSGRFPGAVMLVAREGKVAYFEAIGQSDPAAGTAMRKDSIFRIASMTKPIVSVAVLILVEDGRVQLGDPISKYLPQLARRQVGVEKTDAAGKTVLVMEPARREITVHDLLRHTSGFTYSFMGKSMVKDLYKEGFAGVNSSNVSNAEFVDKLALLPLAYQPGTTWEYGQSHDVLGRMVEVISGKTLGEFLNERILKPLKMHDTGFYVPADKLARLAQPGKDLASGQVPGMPDATKPPKFESGGGGMVSTASDYIRFAQMLLNGGELEGVRILGRKTVELMTANHLDSTVSPGPLFLPGLGNGWGLGLVVRKDVGPALTAGSVGEFGWAGIFGGYFWVDPHEKLIGLMLTQQQSQGLYINRAMKALTEAAVEK
jgi:CubicO group peptidase (beta-lactamase class C family)